MNKPRFSEGIILAVIFSLAISVIFTVMSSFFPTRWLLGAVITGAGFSYIVYLLFRSREKTGKVAVVTLWMVFAFLTWVLSPSVLIMLFVHISLIWLVRALYYHNSIIIALMDLGLIGAGIVVSIWTLLHTQSVLLAVWVFFLIQSLFSVLPDTIQSIGSKSTTSKSEDGFERAYQAAQAAIRHLSTQH